MGCGASKSAAPPGPADAPLPPSVAPSPAPDTRTEAAAVPAEATSAQGAAAARSEPRAAQAPPNRVPARAPHAPPVRRDVVLMIGGPGTGVSEQCAKLAEVFGCHHLAVGKLMRAEVMSESEEGRAIAAMLHEGKPIPATAYASLFRRAVASVPLEPAAEGTPAATFLLDGFPRSTDNARLLEGELGAPTAVLVLSAPDDVARARARRADGAALDDEGALDKRLASYAKRTAPMVEALQRGSAPVHRVDASGAESHVSAAVVRALGWALPAGLALPLAPGDAAAEAAAAAVGEPAATAVESAAVADAAIPPAAAPEDAAAQSDPRRRIVLVLGAPGSGKRTQCALLAERCGYAHLSPSRLLAEAAESGSAEGARIGAQMREGKILPAQVSIDLLRSAMGSRAGPYVVDGFPRSLDSARVLEAQLGAASCVLVLEAAEEALEARLLDGGADPADGAREAIARRYAAFRQAAAPVVEHLSAGGRLHTIAADASAEEVFRQICAALGHEPPPSAPP